ncbi:Uncharacterized protein PBTT_09791 [Plasmodiophora brassicae]
MTVSHSVVVAIFLWLQIVAPRATDINWILHDDEGGPRFALSSPMPTSRASPKTTGSSFLIYMAMDDSAHKVAMSSSACRESRTNISTKGQAMRPRLSSRSCRLRMITSTHMMASVWQCLQSPPLG